MLGAGKLNDWETCRQWRAAKQTRPKKEDVGKKPSGKDAVKVGVSRRHIYIYGASRGVRLKASRCQPFERFRSQFDE